MTSVLRLDHLVLTVRDLQATCAFYEKLGMRAVQFGEGRMALHFGPPGAEQKINLHVAGRELEPKARRPTPGSGDLCLIVQGPLQAVQAALEADGVAIELPPSPRTGANGPIQSIYLRDPDGNLIELSTYGEA